MDWRNSSYCKAFFWSGTSEWISKPILLVEWNWIGTPLFWIGPNTAPFCSNFEGQHVRGRARELEVVAAGGGPAAAGRAREERTASESRDSPEWF